MGSHGRYGKNIWYEESIRIPLYFHGADIPAGESDVLFGSQDHMPTLLQLLDVELPDTIEGKALGSFITKAVAKESPELARAALTEPEHAYLCMFPGMPELVDPYRKLGMNPKSFGWRGIRTKTHTYVVDLGCKPGAEAKRLLYDNVQDPYQLHPQELSSLCPEAQTYDAILKEYLEQLNDPFLLT